MKRVVAIPQNITVGSLAEKLEIPVTSLITELFKNGMMVTVNEKIDVDTANIIVGELGLEVELKPEEIKSDTVVSKATVVAKDAIPRPPVVAVMGHVDHGKTSLLDAIRTANTASREAGGITQHISAYQVKKGDRHITFLDTPGHEAFAALREHGAHLTDVAVVVVAADDGIKPQTLEAIRFARKANARIVVAINKIDKQGADVNRVKQQLAEQELLPEDWGGDTVMVPVSAKTKEGIDHLLEMILLVADVDDLRASETVNARGLIIESHMEVGKGAIAEALVQEGTLKQGDFIVVGSTYAKVRTLQDTDGKNIKKAGPSQPVIIGGFKALAEFGEEFKVVKDEKTARSESESSISKSLDASGGMTSSELLRIINRRTSVNEYNVILKADVQGSLTSVTDSIKTLDNNEVAVRVVSSGVGSITENDILKAEATGSVIYGFNVDMTAGVKQLAMRHSTSVRLYRIIYELIDDVKAELTKLLEPEVIDTDTGRLIIRGIFRTTKDEVICGGEVTKGKLVIPAFARHMRDGNHLEDVEILTLKVGPQDTKEVLEGNMCGMSYRPDGKADVQEGDHFEFFTRSIKQRTL